MGPASKPEILSSLKFLGTSAEKLIAMKDFTEFITIDDEGNIYFLRLVDRMTDENDVIWLYGWSFLTILAYFSIYFLFLIIILAI